MILNFKLTRRSPLNLVLKIRKKGNPLPGSGTLQSKAIEQMGIKVLTVPHWEVDYKRLEQLYGKAVGFTKETKVLEQKKK